jgi:hypothetical protein
MRAQDVMVTLPFSGVDLCTDLGEPMDMLAERLPVGVMHDPPSHLAGLSPDRAHDGRPVIVIGAVTALLVGPTPGRLRRIAVPVALFPPRSETVRLFRNAHLTEAYRVGAVRRWRVTRDVTRARSGDSSPVRVPRPRQVHPTHFMLLDTARLAARVAHSSIRSTIGESMRPIVTLAPHLF